MTLDELIEQLQALRAKHGGDIPVLTQTDSIGGVSVGKPWVGGIRLRYPIAPGPSGDYYNVYSKPDAKKPNAIGVLDPSWIE